MKKISIIHPSRSRPQKALDRFHEWTTKASGAIEYILSIDTSDLKRQQYLDLFIGVNVIVNNNRSLIEATNAGAKVATGDILVVVSDDTHCPPNWDDLIREATKDRTNWVLKTWDGAQPWIVTLPIMDRAFYESIGHIYNPIYKHLFCDTELTHIADLTGRLIIRNDLLFEHANEYYRGTGGDAGNVKSQSTFESGARLYRKRLAQRFGLKNVKNVYDIAPEGNHHLRWLSPRFRK